MTQLLRISRNELFKSSEGKKFPRRIFLLADIQACQADIDVVIGSHGQPDAVNLCIENYLALEKKAKLHILVVETSYSIASYKKIRSGPNISRIFILSPILSTNRFFERFLRASNGAALVAQIGEHFGKAPYTFYSHSDMMGYKKNFLSFLLSKLDEKNVIASFTQRHILPFSGGMIYAKSFLASSGSDWLPKMKNLYQIPSLEAFHAKISHLSWIDAGEQPIFAALQQGKCAYICASRGGTGDFFKHPLAYWELDKQDLHAIQGQLHHAPLALSRSDFRDRYPELVSNDYPWRKCFDDEGNIVFIHRGRGTSQRGKDQRGDFVAFIRRYNNQLSKTQN